MFEAMEEALKQGERLLAAYDAMKVKYGAILTICRKHASPASEPEKHWLACEILKLAGEWEAGR